MAMRCDEQSDSYGHDPDGQDDGDKSTAGHMQAQRPLKQ
jgi:hypothetical protein